MTTIEQHINLSFYKYFLISNIKKFYDQLYHIFMKFHILGRIYIASEGINAQLSVPKKFLEEFRKTLYSIHPKLDKIILNIAIDNDQQAFKLLSIKIRSKIIADGLINFIFNPNQVGEYLQAEEVNSMIYDPSVVFVDMRNYYEYEIGHFKGAINIPTKTFREQLSIVVMILQNYKNKKIVLYCTGGIRCEKASALLLCNDFKKVYQIEGGIIRYTNVAKTKGLPIQFIGKNFVFDNRLVERITNDIIARCYQCQDICDTHRNCNYKSCNLLFIQCLNCTKKYNYCCSLICKEKFSLKK